MVEKYYRIYKNEVEIIDAVRVGRIKNGGKILSRNSEYDYIFYKGKSPSFGRGKNSEGKNI